MSPGAQKIKGRVRAVRFKPGMLGACIVVLALLGTVLIGFNLGVDERTEYQTAYRNITNITSQFSYTEGDTFVNYNPAQNYTGYTSGTIKFTESGTANQYSYIVTPGTHQTETVDLTETSWYSTNTHETGSRVLMGDSSNWWLLGGYHTTVSSILTHEGIDYTLYENGVTINLIYGTPYYFGTIPTANYYQASPNLVTASTTPGLSSVLGSSSGYIHKTDGTSQLFTDGNPWSWGSALRPYSFTENDNLGLTIHVLKSGETRVIKNGSTVNISTAGDTHIYWSDTAVYTTNSGLAPAGPSGPFSGNTGNQADLQVSEIGTQGLTPTAMITIDYDVGTVAKYMRISDGVSFLDPTDYQGTNTPYYPHWTNGKDNGVISWVVKFDDLNSGNYWMASPVFGAYGNPIILTAYTSTGHKVVVNYNDGGYNNSIILGGWDTLLLTFDSINRTFTCAPVVSFSNFQNFTVSPDTVTIADTFPVFSGVSETLTFSDVAFWVDSDSSNDYTFSVYQTTINMGFNSNIFVNPTLNPRSLFLPADYPILRITFDSVALVGDSITLNGVSYPISSGVFIVDNTKIPISGLSVTYSDDGHIYANDVDLGTASDTNISLRGQWYFQARASQGYLEEVDVIDWEVGQWSIDFQQGVVLYELVIIAGIIICYYKKSLSMLDWVILIIAMFGGAVLFV